MKHIITLFSFSLCLISQTWAEDMTPKVSGRRERSHKVWNDILSRRSNLEFDPVVAQSSAQVPQVQQSPPQNQRSSGNIGVFPFPSGTNFLAAASSAPTQPEPETSVNTSPAGSLVARLHGHGILGYVLFTPDTNSGRTLIKARVVTASGRSELFSWKIHSQPQQIGSIGCSAITIGPVMTDLSAVHGQLQSDKDLVFTSSAVDLFSDKNLLGRTLVLHAMSSGAFVCATILPATRKRVYEAKFHWPISGTIRLIQTSTATGILSEYMMYSDGSRVSSSHSWTIAEGSAQDATLEQKFKYETSKCQGLTGNSLLLSSTGVNPITVSTEMPGVKGRSYQVLSNIRSLEPSPVAYFILFDEENPQEILACAVLTEVQSKSARVKFPSDSDVQGSLTFSQETPFDATKVEASLKLNTKAYSYGIDLIPTIRRRKNEPKSCPNIKETIYNPFFKDPEEIPPEGQGTTDQYAVGDLSGKFGTLSNKNQEFFTTWDFNLPLFGQFSVVGRAVVIYAPDGPAIACSNIELIGKNVSTAYATFDVPLQGQFIFRQPLGECSTDTYVYIEISKPDGSENKKTFNHPWHIHENPVTAGFEHLSSTDCAGAGGHLNPYNVSTDCIYQRDCTMFTPHRCEVGDVSGKLGPIDVPTYKSSPTGEPDVGKYYFVDTDLSLCGPTSVTGKSVVIHKHHFGKDRMTCANILEFKPRAG